MNSKFQRASVQQKLQSMAAIKNIVLVVSGKGGVGKSTVALNVALGLQAAGARVGLLDADIYGPSIPTMLGVSLKPEITAAKEFIPLQIQGLQVMSFGFLLEESAPVIWRGPMVCQAVKQMLFSSQWNALDFLIIDMPPGTGDIQLSVAQNIPVAGAIAVTTAEDVATLDCKKAILMLQKVGIRVLGVVENMSYFECKCCNAQESLFGQQGGGAALAVDTGIPFLQALPFDKNIGYSPKIADGQYVVASQYNTLANTLLELFANVDKARQVNVKIAIEE